MKSLCSLTMAAFAATALVAPQVFAQLAPVAKPAPASSPTLPGGLKLRQSTSALAAKPTVDACAIAKADASLVYDMQPHVASTATAEATGDFGGTYPAYVNKTGCPLYIVDFTVGGGNGPKPSVTDPTTPKFYVHPEQVIGLLATSATGGLDRWCIMPTQPGGSLPAFVVNLGYYVKKPDAAGFVHLKSIAFRSRIYVGNVPLPAGGVIPGTATCRLVPDAPVDAFPYPSTGTVVYRVVAEALYTQTDWYAFATGSYNAMQPTIAASVKPPPGILPPPSIHLPPQSRP